MLPGAATPPQASSSSGCAPPFTAPMQPGVSYVGGGPPAIAQMQPFASYVGGGPPAIGQMQPFTSYIGGPPPSGMPPLEPPPLAGGQGTPPMAGVPAMAGGGPPVGQLPPTGFSSVGPMGAGPNPFGSMPFSPSAIYGPSGIAAAATPPGRSQDLSGVALPGSPLHQSMPPLGAGGGMPPTDWSLTQSLPPMMPPTHGQSFQAVPPTMPSTAGPPMSMPFQPPGGGPGGPSFRTMSTHQSDFMAGAPALAPEFTLQICRLLDMPIEKTVFGGIKKYRVVAFDGDDRKLGHSIDISGVPASNARDRETETINVSQADGTVRLRTTSMLVYLQVDHIGGFTGDQPIGRCQIHRLDPRSSQIWPYLLSDKDGGPANCGIELKVIEGHSSMPPGGQFSADSPFATHRPPGSMALPPTAGYPAPGSPSMASLGSGTLGKPPGSGRKPKLAAMHDISHGVSALLEFDRATDLPYSRSEGQGELMITVRSDDDREKELRRVGPFNARGQGSGLPRRLVSADCMGSRIFVHAPLHFGGDAQEGAMFIRVEISWVKGKTGVEVIGITDPIRVSWRPAAMHYYEIRPKGGRAVLGGIQMSHRLVTEAEASPDSDVGAAAVPGKMPMPQIGAPIEPFHRVSGRTGNFPPGSGEEAFEQATINCEAQNRALLQRVNIADPHSHEHNPHIRIVNGYREWDSLDSLFATMGPNPLTMSEELGPSVCRSYLESTSVLKELAPQLGPVMSPADEQLNLKLLETMYEADPFKANAALRPVICKDPSEIAGSKDMQWCPDPPVYAPMRHMREEDKETLRLACFDPAQNAKIMFVDANPNYRLNEDVWGIMADYKKAKSLYVPKPASAHRRVKDDCLMS